MDGADALRHHAGSADPGDDDVFRSEANEGRKRVVEPVHSKDDLNVMKRKRGTTDDDIIYAMKVLGAQGGEETVELRGAKFRPYPRRGAQIENLCGIFGQRVEVRNLCGLMVDASTPFGMQHEMFHIEGNVNVSQGRGMFKACRSLAGARRLGESLYLEDPGKIRVHMGVLTARLGRRVQVSWLGYLDTRLQATYMKYIKFTPRLDDNNNSVRFEIKDFSGGFEIEESIKPLTNDWTVTGKGAVIIRFTWKPMWWTEAEEDRVIKYAGKIVGLLDACC